MKIKLVAVVMLLSAIALYAGVVGAGIPVDVSQSSTAISTSQWLSPYRVRWWGTTRCTVTVPQLDLQYTCLKDSQFVHISPTTSHYNTYLHQQSHSENYTAETHPGTYEAYGYHHARNEVGHVLDSYASPWSFAVVGERGTTLSQVEVEAAVASKEAALSAMAVKMFSEVEGWEVYPLFERWRDGTRDEFDLFLMGEVLESVTEGDWKPSVFVNELSVAIIIQKYDDTSLKLLYEQNNEGDFAIQRVMSR